MIEIISFSPKYKKVNKELIKKIVNKVFRLEKKSLKNTDLSIAFISKKDIMSLNKKYLKNNCPTDVLSFGKTGKDKAVEIVICAEEIYEYNKDRFQEELIRVLIHGLLHVIGHDHEKSKKQAEAMFLKQEKLVKLWPKQKLLLA